MWTLRCFITCVHRCSLSWVELSWVALEGLAGIRLVSWYIAAPLKYSVGVKLPLKSLLEALFYRQISTGGRLFTVKTRLLARYYWARRQEVDYVAPDVDYVAPDIQWLLSSYTEVCLGRYECVNQCPRVSAYLYIRVICINIYLKRYKYSIFAVFYVQ